MAKKWRNLDIKSIAKNKAKETDQQLADQILDLRELKEDEIKSFFPKKADREKVDELMRIVKSSEDRNRKINQIVANSEKFAGVIKKLLDIVI